jgi:RHH-type transcriptional regulator, proline utilization regulon repressor / proline dehydrogenase / delta 1-pyrroline-5-carboxylate dehydrogenase
MFKNEPLTDFTVASNRWLVVQALEELSKKISAGALRAFPIIDGKEIKAGAIFERFDPSDSSILLGKTVFATAADVDAAIRSLKAGSERWEEVPSSERASILMRAAEEMRNQKGYLTALIIREAGKPWKEADADVAEAIDFCAYYAEEMLRLDRPLKTMEVPGEDNIYLYQPRGIAAVISPWNFPLAIACGMVTAALVTGNVVIFKPSEQTSLIGCELAKILLKSGIPPYAFAFVPGYGEEVGRQMVQSPEVGIICFTGSRAVGVEILSSASKLAPGQDHIKRVVLELGGKNAIIVDEDADLDEAVKGVLYSSFGFSGQKCSACSRVLVVGSAKEHFTKRFCEAARDVIIGSASNPSTLVGPVIDKESQERILKTISEAEKASKVGFKGSAPESGFFIPPTIFLDVDDKSSLWREEVFGPVVAVRNVATLDNAIQEATASEYALTGGLFSRSPSSIEKAKRKFKVGNLYINRACTGAMVCRQPFGGFKMSGVGSKAGGRDYLLQFMEPRTITENTMRRGFTPQ